MWKAVQDADLIRFAKSIKKSLIINTLLARTTLSRYAAGSIARMCGTTLSADVCEAALG